MIREKRRTQLLKARERRNRLIVVREQEKAAGRRYRNMTLTAREDLVQGYRRTAASLYRLAERGQEPSQSRT